MCLRVAILRKFLIYIHRFQISVTENQYSIKFLLIKNCCSLTFTLLKYLTFLQRITFQEHNTCSSKISTAAKSFDSVSKIKKDLMKHVIENHLKFCAFWNQNLIVCIVISNAENCISSALYIFDRCFFCLWRWEQNNNSSPFRKNNVIHWNSHCNHASYHRLPLLVLKFLCLIIITVLIYRLYTPCMWECDVLFL